jgi:glycosyltransferase involved in cell wall biosynthesis
MKKAQSKVSVIIPTYNAARYIGKAIESVLAQTYKDYEIIVVDDGSTDNTREVLIPYENHIHYIYQENQKLPAARNAGVAASSGQYLTFLDSDDLLLPDKLALQISSLEAQSKIGLIASGWQYINEEGQLLGELRPWLNSSVINMESLLFQGLAPVHAVLVRRSWFDDIGGFDSSLPYCEDMDFWYRLYLSGCEMSWEPAIVCQYRIHDANMTRNPREHFKTFFSVLDKVFVRPDLPDTIRQRKDELYAQIRVAEASRLYNAGYTDEAKASLQTALVLDPSLFDENNHRILDVIADWYKNVWVRDREQFLERVLSNLPPELSLSPMQQEQIYTNINKAKFYEAFELGNAKTIQKCWIAIARRDPSWLLNRGSWSILCRSFLGKTKNRADYSSS